MRAAYRDCEAILFDLDGVLVDSAASVRRQWDAWAARHGVDPAALHAAMHGRRSVDLVALVAPRLDAAAEARAVDEAQAADPAVRAIEGAAELLAALPPARWAIVTSGSRRLALARLRFAGLPRPRVLVCAEDVPRGKPDPAGYLAAAAALNRAPRACLVVEDAPAGVHAGVAAGMRVVALTTSHPADELLAAGAAVALPSLAGQTAYRFLS